MRQKVRKMCEDVGCFTAHETARASRGNVVSCQRWRERKVIRPREREDSADMY
jgi:hypothetical protein